MTVEMFNFKNDRIPVRDFYIRIVPRSSITSFIEKWHYSNSINGLISDYSFALYRGNEIIGAMIYGKMAMHNQWRPYGECEEEVVELRRLCCIDETPKNTESRFIGLTLKWLKSNTNIKTVISYADPNYGHAGIIYKASNFKHIGMSSPGRVIVYNGKKYHDKTIRTKYKGEIKPFATEIINALNSGIAEYKPQKPKHIYIYEIKRKNKADAF